MKKIFSIIALSLLWNVFAMGQSPNPIVERLSQQEVATCTTPASIAYNYVISILNKDYNRAASYMTKESAQKWLETDVSELNNLFSTPGKLNIHGWKPALSQGYEVAILYVQDLWYYEEDGRMNHDSDAEEKDGMIYLPGEDMPRVGINIKKIYVACSPSSEIGNVGFQDITRYGDTNVKVVLLKFDGVWKVLGLK